MNVHMNEQMFQVVTDSSKRKGEGFMRPATMIELYQDQMKDGLEE